MNDTSNKENSETDESGEHAEFAESRKIPFIGSAWQNHRPYNRAF